MMKVLFTINSTITSTTKSHQKAIQNEHKKIPLKLTIFGRMSRMRSEMTGTTVFWMHTNHKLTIPIWEMRAISRRICRRSGRKGRLCRKQARFRRWKHQRKQARWSKYRSTNGTCAICDPLITTRRIIWRIWAWIRAIFGVRWTSKWASPKKVNYRELTSLINFQRITIQK